MAKASLKPGGPRILFYDIETTHNIVAVFRLFGEDYINHANLLRERYVVCACWKWLGEDKVHSVAVTDDPKRFKKNPADDRHVVETLHNVLSEADVIVAHNGDAYDIKFVNGRAIFHKLPPLPPKTSVDTLKVAKAKFLFNSNRLDYLGHYLGLGRKIETRQGLWLDVLRGDRKAVLEMVSYNKGDVTLLEKVFQRLRPYMPEHINRELFGGGPNECPRCGSTHVQSRGVHRAISRIYRRFQCQECSGWFRAAKAERGETKLRNI